MKHIQWINMIAMLDGNVSRICTTDSLEELLNQMGFAIDRIQLLVVNRRNELKKRFDNRNEKST